MKVVLIIQARCNSSKIPYKIVKNLTSNMTMIEHTIQRCSKSNVVNQTIINTTVNYSDEKLINILRHKNMITNLSIYRGSETNVLERTYQAAQICQADVVVRVMATTPFIDTQIIDMVVHFFNDNDYDYIYVGTKNKFPDGFGFDVFNIRTLEHAYQHATNLYDLEHITSYILNNPTIYRSYNYNILNPNPLNFKKTNYPNIDFNRLTLGIKTPLDWAFVKRLYTTVYNQNNDFRFQDVLSFLNTHSDMISYPNERILTDTIYYGKGQQLSAMAKQVIPNGVQDMTKYSYTHLPDLYPSYYVKANNIEITTMDGFKLKDFSSMSSGSCILGYCDSDVDAAVHDSIERGNLTSLSNPNEVKLAKQLIKLHPWASFAKYTKSESNALSLAVKIVRESNNKHIILVSGNMGWHDIYKHKSQHNKIDPIYTTSNNIKLSNDYIQVNIHDYDSIAKIIKKKYKQISAIMIEPATNIPISLDTFKLLRDITTKYNIKLIVNETKYGFRVNTGGLHLLYDLQPDLAVFGRSMSNGYSLAAVVGDRLLMPSARSVFANDICWSDDIGINAAIETINKHELMNVGKQIKAVGRHFQQKLYELAQKHEIKLNITGMPSLTQFNFNYPIIDDNKYDNYTEFDLGEPHKMGNINNALKTLYIQLMLKYHILADSVFYPSYAHTFELVDYYLEHIDKVFSEIKHLLDTKNIHKELLTQPAEKSYQQLH
jgi:glutamate-1-semialdehyde 2,1-aminomutase